MDAIPSRRPSVAALLEQVNTDLIIKALREKAREIEREQKRKRKLPYILGPDGRTKIYLRAKEDDSSSE